MKHKRQRGFLDKTLGYVFLKKKLERLTIKNGECLVWTGNLSVHGYPRIRHGADLFFVHRLVRSIADRTPYSDVHVHHECRNRACVSLEHLRVVTPEEHSRIHQPSRTVCGRGHSMAGSYRRPDTGTQQCRQCIKIRGRWDLERERFKQSVRPPVGLRPCAVCGKPFAPSYRQRKHATMCGQACRMRKFLTLHPGYKKHGALRAEA